MKAVRTFLVLGALLLWSCTHNTAPSEKEIARLAPQELGNGALQITTEREDYSWRASDLGSNQIIVATVENLSDNTLYARLGGGFSGIEQERLSVASGSHGYLEQWQQGIGWREMPRSEFIEGVRYVVLEPKKNYRLIAALFKWQRIETGEFRMRVEYFDRIDPEDGATPHMDYSNVFSISH